MVARSFRQQGFGAIFRLAPIRRAMVMPQVRGVHAEGAIDPCHPAFPQPNPCRQNCGISCAHTAIIPTNSVIDASAAASSTKILNILAS